MPVGAHVPLRLSLDAFTGTARQSAQAIILHVYRDFLNVEIGITEARKAQVLGLDDLDRPPGTQRLFISKGCLWQCTVRQRSRIAFPLIALVATACVALSRTGDAAAGQGHPRPGGGGPPGPEPAPDPPDGSRPAVTDDDAGLAAGLPGLHEPGPGIEQDRLVAALADAVVQPAEMR